MTKQLSHAEVLEKAIAIAIVNGWLPYFAAFDNYMTRGTIVHAPIAEGHTDVLFGVNASGYVTYAGQYRLTIPEIIFDHGFAKALWGEELIQYPEGDQYTIPAEFSPAPNFCRSERLFVWQFRLQQMVIADDPIEYLADNLPERKK